MYNGLLHAHSGLRWVVLVLMLLAIAKSVSGLRSGQGLGRISFLAGLAFKIQYVIGLILYFVSPYVSFHEGWMKDSSARFFGLEHLVGVTIAIALVEIGMGKAKRAEDASTKHRKTILFFSLSLIVVFLSIPWPFMRDVFAGRGWF